MALTTSQPIPKSLRNPCIYPASCLHLTLHPVFSSRHSCILHHPAFSHVILRSPAFSCITLHLHLASLVVLSSLECSIGSRTGTSLFPSLRLSSLVFRSSAPHSVIRSIPPFSLPFHVFSSEATLSWDFLSPRPLFFPPPFCKPPHQILCHSIVIVAAFCSIHSRFLEFSPFHCLEGSRLLFLSPFVSQL